MHKNLTDYIRLHNEADNLYLRMEPGTGKRVNLPYLLDALPPHRRRYPRGPVICDVDIFYAISDLCRPSSLFGFTLLPVATHTVGVPVIIAHQLKGLLRDMQRNGCDKIQRTEHFKVLFIPAVRHL